MAGPMRVNLIPESLNWEAEATKRWDDLEAIWAAYRQCKHEPLPIILVAAIEASLRE